MTPRQVKEFAEKKEADFAIGVPGRRPLPDQHLPAARHAGLRLPRHSLRGEDDPRAAPAGGARGDRAQAARPGAGHRRDRLGQVDHAGGDDQPRQPEPPGQHHHDRGPDRVPAPRRDGQHLPARGGQRHPVVRDRAAARAAAGPRRDPDRRDPRPGDAGHRAQGGRHRPPGVLDAAHHRRDPDHQPHHLVLPAAPAPGDPDRCSRPRSQAVDLPAPGAARRTAGAGCRRRRC